MVDGNIDVQGIYAAATNRVKTEILDEENTVKLSLYQNMFVQREVIQQAFTRRDQIIEIDRLIRYAGGVSIDIFSRRKALGDEIKTLDHIMEQTIHAMSDLARELGRERSRE